MIDKLLLLAYTDLLIIEYLIIIIIIIIIWVTLFKCWVEFGQLFAYLQLLTLHRLQRIRKCVYSNSYDK